MVVEVAYLFPGQGAQFVGMGKDFYETFKESRQVFDKANELLGFDLKNICFNGPAEELVKTSISQPAILTTSIACLAALESKFKSEISPKFVAGLSLGEITALVSAGCLSFEEGVLFVRDRGKFMEEASAQNPGKMAAILGLSLEETEKVCKEAGAEIANLNCPGQIVISASQENMQKAVDLAKERGAKRAIILDVSGPFHSSLMNPAALKLKEKLEKINLKQANLPIVSNVTAQEETSPEKIKQNLFVQVSNRTLWEKSMRYMISKNINTFLEIGPGKVLSGFMKKIGAQKTIYNIEKIEDLDKLWQK